MRLLVTRWKTTYKVLATDDGGNYLYEVAALYDRRGRLYINGTVADVGNDGMLMLATARIIADAARSGLSVGEVLELLKEGA